MKPAQEEKLFSGCGFCYPREQGTHGEVKREWSTDYRLFIPVCRKHSFENLPPVEPDKEES